MIDQQIISLPELVTRMTAKHEAGTCADLTGRVVDQPLKITNKMLRGVDLSNTIFRETVDFTGCTFAGLSWFRNSEFDRSAIFSGCQFFNDARFDNASFKSDVRFDAVIFKGISAFDDCRMDGGLGFASVEAHGNVSMSRAMISGRADFSNSNIMGGLWCPKANFGHADGLSTLDLYGRCVTDNSNFKLHKSCC